MVQVVNYQARTTEDGKQFFILNLEGDVEFVKSESTGKTYATVRKCNLSTTFSEITCQRLVGTQLEGSIQKVECEPYEYANPATGEVMVLNSRYEYLPEGVSAPKVQHQSLANEFVASNPVSANGHHKFEPAL
jgi:hypothetical protein